MKKFEVTRNYLKGKYYIGFACGGFASAIWFFLWFYVSHILSIIWALSLFWLIDRLEEREHKKEYAGKRQVKE